VLTEKKKLVSDKIRNSFLAYKQKFQSLSHGRVQNFCQIRTKEAKTRVIYVHRKIFLCNPPHPPTKILDTTLTIVHNTFKEL
jgi:hypothetical protein